MSRNYKNYRSPSKRQIDNEVKNLISEIAVFFMLEKYKENPFFVDGEMLRDIIIRIDQRVAYHRIFHNGNEMSELRRAALLAYWIVKYKPIQCHKDVDMPYDVNCSIAMHFLTSAASKYAEIKNGKRVSLNISKEYIDRAMYGFKHWDISKESMMCIVESIAGT